MTLYILYRIGIALALALPVRVSYWCASRLGSLFCRFSAADRTAVESNLRAVVGAPVDEKAVRRMSREVFKNFAKYLVDFFRFTKIDEAYIRKCVRIEGARNIDAARAKGKGGILLSAHIGNWELGGAAVALSGYPLSAVVLTHQNTMINDFFTAQRLKGRMKPIEIGAALRTCYRVLKKNELLALLGDRDFTKNGIVTEFFGRKALMPKGPAVFAYREGAAILPTFMVRQPDDTYRLTISEPIYADHSLGEDAAIEALIARYLRSIEACIREHPTQWYVFRDLWNGDERNALRPDTII